MVLVGIINKGIFNTVMHLTFDVEQPLSDKKMTFNMKMTSNMNIEDNLKYEDDIKWKNKQTKSNLQN